MRKGKMKVFIGLLKTFIKYGNKGVWEYTG